jgi:hypothetical protein
VGRWVIIDWANMKRVEFSISAKYKLKLVSLLRRKSREWHLQRKVAFSEAHRRDNSFDDEGFKIHTCRT